MPEQSKGSNERRDGSSTALLIVDKAGQLMWYQLKEYGARLLVYTYSTALDADVKATANCLIESCQNRIPFLWFKEQPVEAELLQSYLRQIRRKENAATSVPRPKWTRLCLSAIGCC